MTSRSSRVFEWSLLAIVIGIVLVFAAGLYGRMAGDVQRLSFDLAAQNFKTALTGVHAQWYVQRTRGEVDDDVVLFSELPGRPTGLEDASTITVYLNARGWPESTRSRRAASDGRLSAEECLELWKAFLHQAPAASLEDPPAPSAVFGVSSVDKGRDRACRFRHLVDAGRGQYFDYRPSDGTVTIVSSPE